MPNWVYNTLTVDATAYPEAGWQLRNQLDRPFTQMHHTFVAGGGFEQVETLYSNPVMAFWNVLRPTNDELEEYFGVSALPRDAQDPARVSNHWYDWNIRNWDTKWDVAVSDDNEFPNTTLEVSDDGHTFTYRFRTAWSPAHHVVELLADQWSMLDFTYHYEEEQGWGGEIEYSEGTESSRTEWDIPQSHSDEYDRKGSCSGCDSIGEEYDPDNDWAYKDCPAVIEYNNKKTLEVSK